jgi:hypothetical protein
MHAMLKFAFLFMVLVVFAIYINSEVKKSESKEQAEVAGLRDAYAKLQLAEAAYKEKSWQGILDILSGSSLEFNCLDYNDRARVDVLKSCAEAELKAIPLTLATEVAIRRKDWDTAIHNILIIENHLQGTYCSETSARFYEFKIRVKNEIGDYETRWVSADSETEPTGGLASSYSGASRSYSNQGGHYEGGQGSSHKGGHYVNPLTNNHYRGHK